MRARIVLVALLAVAASRGACERFPAYDACAGKACGETCTVCPPGATDCAETAVLKACDPQGRCVADAGDLCGAVAACAREDLRRALHHRPALPRRDPALHDAVGARTLRRGRRLHPGRPAPARLLPAARPRHPDCVGKACGDSVQPVRPRRDLPDAHPVPRATASAAAPARCPGSATTRAPGRPAASPATPARRRRDGEGCVETPELKACDAAGRCASAPAVVRRPARATAARRWRGSTSRPPARSPRAGCGGPGSCVKPLRSAFASSCSGRRWSAFTAYSPASCFTSSSRVGEDLELLDAHGLGALEAEDEPHVLGDVVRRVAEELADLRDDVPVGAHDHRAGAGRAGVAARRAVGEEARALRPLGLLGGPLGLRARAPPAAARSRFGAVALDLRERPSPRRSPRRRAARPSRRRSALRTLMPFEPAPRRRARAPSRPPRPGRRRR